MCSVVSVESIPSGVSVEPLPSGVSVESIPSGVSVELIPSGVSVETFPSGLSVDQRASLGVPSVSEASVKPGEGHGDEAVEVQVTSTRRRGVPEFGIEELFKKHCCSRSVVTCFRKLSQLDIESVREHFYSLKSETAQSQHVIDYFTQHSSCGSDILYAVGGKTVCETCWRLVYGLRYNKFSSVKQKFLAGVVRVEHGRQGLVQPRDRTLRASSWLRSFVEKVGDRMPMQPVLHLPSCLTKADVYGLACDDLTQGNMPCCSVSTFYDLWLKEFSHVQIPKENRFSTCDVCAAIREGRERTLNPTVREWLGKVQEKHMQLQSTEREKYAKHRHKAEKYSSRYMSIIIDGMDQDKTNVPHLISTPKAMAGAFTLETHVTGVRVHGRCTVMFIDCQQFPHDSNLTIELLTHVFLKYKDDLPGVLYLQMDNTCRDNKNKFTLTFAALLVQLGVFRKVKIGCLPVGHTHEDIDQLFSCISRQLKHTNVLTLPDLEETIRKSFTPEPEVIEVTQVHNTKEWMRPHVPSIHDHLKAHLFKFESNQDGDVRMFYKEWSGDPFWLPQAGIPLLVVHEGRLCPTGPPDLLTPCYDSESLQKLKTTLDKIAAYLEKSGAKEWWASWMRSVSEVNEDQSSAQDSWLLQCEGLEKVSTSEPLRGNDTMSGVEVESPYKAAQREKEDEAEVPGIGKISTRWVGSKGRQELMEAAEHDRNKTEVQGLKVELRTLADECRQALLQLGADKSSHPQVQKAYSLCETYLEPSRKRKTSSLNQKMDALWKGRGERLPGTLTGTAAATAVLGPQLVDTITEKHKQAPDARSKPIQDGRVPLPSPK